jgi:hypothetical protein
MAALHQLSADTTQTFFCAIWLQLFCKACVSVAAFSSRKENFLNVTWDVSEGCREEFSNTNKKQIIEPVRKLQDESNDTN